MRTALSPDQTKLVMSTSSGYIMVVHDFDIDTIADDLNGFIVSKYVPTIYMYLDLSLNCNAIRKLQVTPMLWSGSVRLSKYRLLVHHTLLYTCSCNFQGTHASLRFLFYSIMNIRSLFKTKEKFVKYQHISDMGSFGSQVLVGTQINCLAVIITIQLFLKFKSC